MRHIVAAAVMSMMVGIAPAHAAGAAALDPERVVVTEPVKGSDIPVHLMYIEMVDGVYAPIGLRKPPGDGPFPIVLLAAGNGGGGMAWVRRFTQEEGWTQEEFLKAGYAVAWTRYRAEVDYAYNKYGKLVQDIRQGRQLLNRGPVEYEDMIAIAEYVKTLPYIDPKRVGYLGLSHGGEMVMKITSEYHGFAAMVANEPASHEFLGLTPDNTASINPATGLLNVERMLMRDAATVRPRINEELTKKRVAPIKTPIFVHGRDPDELQGIFRLTYDVLVENGKVAEWKSYDHDVHGFIYPERNAKGEYDPDPVQREAVADTIAFLDKYLKP